MGYWEERVDRIMFNRIWEVKWGGGVKDNFEGVELEYGVIVLVEKSIEEIGFRWKIYLFFVMLSLRCSGIFR